MNIKNKLKQCLINPCNKCLVYGCCANACTKLKSFVKNQSIIWISIGCIITSLTLIFLIYKFYSIIHPITISTVIICWLSVGSLIYKAVSSPNKNNIFLVMLSFIWLPYLTLSVVIGMLIALFFTRKRNIKFITGDIWKEKIN